MCARQCNVVRCAGGTGSSVVDKTVMTRLHALQDTTISHAVLHVCLHSYPSGWLLPSAVRARRSVSYARTCARVHRGLLQVPFSPWGSTVRGSFSLVLGPCLPCNATPVLHLCPQFPACHALRIDARGLWTFAGHADSILKTHTIMYLDIHTHAYIIYVLVLKGCGKLRVCAIFAGFLGWQVPPLGYDIRGTAHCNAEPNHHRNKPGRQSGGGCLWAAKEIGTVLWHIRPLPRWCLWHALSEHAVALCVATLR